MARRSSRNVRNGFSARSRAPGLKRMFQFGGSLLKKSNAKTARPLSTKHGMHVVLRSSKAKGEWSLRSLKNQKMVEKTLKILAKKYGIKIQEFANAGNHLQLLIKLKNREGFKPFVRALTGTIAIKVTGATKLKALEEKFWDYRPWTRIVELKKTYSVAKDDLILKHLEKIGILVSLPRNYEDYFLKGAPS